MRTTKAFSPTCGDRLEARDVPSSFGTNILVRGGPAPVQHVYPVGTFTPYAIGHAPGTPSLPVTPPSGGAPFVLSKLGHR